MKKRVLFIMSSLGGGGAEKALITMLTNFDYRRFDITLALTTKSGIYLSEVPKEVRVVPFWSKPGCFVEKLSFFLYSRLSIKSFERFLVRNAIREQYDTIVSYCQGRALKFHGYLFDRAKRNISWVHTDMYSPTSSMNSGVISKKDEKKCYEAMNEVVFVSKEAQTQFYKLGYTLKCSSVVNNPIDKDHIFKYVKIKQSNITHPDNINIPTIVLCGRLDKVKAFDRIVRVAAKLRDDGLSFRVHLIGTGDEQENLESLISSLNLSSFVYLLGFQFPPYPAMAEGDIFVSCSLAEGYPLNVCEALCLGLPIIATECTGNNEVLNYGEFGMLVPQDENKLYEAIKEMIVNESLRNEYRKKAEKGALNFDMDKVMAKVYNVL